MPPATPAATNSAQALSNLQSFQQNLQSPDQIINSTNQSLGVDQAGQQVSGLRQAINNTTNLINKVAPSVYGRTAGSLVTDAQATKQIGNEQAPLNTTLDKENTDYGNANSDYSSLQDKASTLANAKLTGQNQEETYLQNIYNSLYGSEKDASSLAEQKREFDAQQATAAAKNTNTSANPTFGNSNNSNSGKTTDPVQQAAFNDVNTRLNNPSTSSSSALISDYNATLKSANYGNLQDQYKIQLYKQLRPDLFGSSTGAIPVNQLGGSLQAASRL